MFESKLNDHKLKCQLLFQSIAFLNKRFVEINSESIKVAAKESTKKLFTELIESH